METENITKEIELGIEGDGNDAILRQFGVNVKKVHPVWKVREGDIFSYPKHRGLETVPPEWEEVGQSLKVVRVVYPVEMNDGSVEYLIAERESVKTNLFAHIRNNLMNETFGLVTGKNSKGKERTRYDATPVKRKPSKQRNRKSMKPYENVKPWMICWHVKLPDHISVRMAGYTGIHDRAEDEE